MKARKLRIGQVLTSVWDGGLEKTVLQVAAGLPQDRFDSKVYALLDHNPWSSELARRGIAFESFGARNRGGAAAIPANLRAVLRLSWAMRRDRIDVVVVHDFFPAVMGRLASVMAGTRRRVAVLHSTYDWLGPGHGAINRLLARWTDVVVAVSAASRDDSLRRDRLPPEKYRVLHNGVDQDVFRPDPEARRRVREELGLTEDSIAIGYVAGIRESKRQLDLIEAVAKLRERHPQAQLVLVGSVRSHESEYARSVENAIAAMGPGAWIHRLEDRRDVPAILSALDAYAAPSSSEGFGLALVEAMMCGLPVCCSDIPAFREICDAGDAVALLHPAGDADCLRRNLDDLLGDHGRRHAMGARAREWVVGRFSERAMLSGWEGLFDELLRSDHA